MDSPKNIIFDLDGTLIDTQFPAGAKAAFVLGCRAPVHICGAELGNLHIYKRPGLDEFLKWCFENFDNVGIWTLSHPEWLDEVLEHVLYDFPREKWCLLWTGKRATRISSARRSREDNCVTMNGYRVVKDLNKIYRNKALRNKGFHRSNTIIVEDTPENCIRNYGNAVYISTFDILFTKQDQELFRLKRYFEQNLMTLHNVRSVDKRRWSEDMVTWEQEEKMKTKDLNKPKQSSAFWMSDAWSQGLKAITNASIGFST